MDIKFSSPKPQQLALVGAILALLIVVGFAVYIELFAAHVDPLAVNGHSYSTRGIDTLAKPGSIADKTTALKSVDPSAGQAVQYSPDDLGKTDLTTLE